VALRWLVEALSGLEQRDPAGLLRLCRALTAIAHALVGDAESARQLLGDVGPRPAAATVFEPQVGLAGAWLAAAEGRPTDAAELALAAAEIAADQGQQAVEALLLHAALGFGAAGDVVERLRQLCRHLDARLLDVVALEAAASVEGAGAGAGLDRASKRFEECGALMWAAAAAAKAAAAHERMGNRQAAAVSRSRAVSLGRVCGLADTPGVDVQAPPTLTSREEQVARLAALGLTNQGIADKLVVSVRTIETHLAHVYAKLGITGRATLSAALNSVAEARRTATHAVGIPAAFSPRQDGRLRPV
jgi:DNA-binding NarL/FixJ family response regulator